MNRSKLFDIVIDSVKYDIFPSLKTNDEFLRVLAFLKRYPSPENVEDLKWKFLNNKKINLPSIMVY